MLGISNFKRVQSIIRERTSNNKIITIFSFLLAFILLFSSYLYPQFSYSIKVKIIDYSSNIINAMYSPINTINNSSKNINKILNVYNINNKLIIENEKLKNISTEMIKIKSENQKLKNLLNLSNNIKYKYTTAKIISRSNSSFIRSVILMAGNKDKLSLGSPVVYNNYLLGYINELGANSSRVLSITDINIKVPSIIIEKNIKFIITGSNKKFLEILNYGDLSSLKSGDKVFTSGDGNMYPEGLIIGTVRINSNGDFVIEPSVDINNINYVQIINWKPSDRGIDINLDPVFYD